MTFDLGGSVRDCDALSDELRRARLVVVPAEEDRLWRHAYSLGRRRVVQLERFEANIGSGDLERVPTEIRIHPVGVITVRFWLVHEVEGFAEAYELNERVAEWRDRVGALFFRGEKCPDDVVSRVETVQELASRVVEARPSLCRRNALNTLQVVELPAAGDPALVSEWIEQFGARQGAPLGPDGGVLTADPLSLARWKDAVVCHLGGGQTLAISDSLEHRSDLIAAYERAHVLRYWLRAWIEVLDDFSETKERRSVLDRQGVRALSLEHLRLMDLHQSVSRALSEVDDRNVPFSSIFGRQLTSAFGRMFEIEGWKRSLLDRLDAAAARSAFIGTVLEREFQLSAHRQNEKLQLLFAGSLAATIMALLPALLALSEPRGPVWPWVAATVLGSALIWIVTVYLVVRRWKVQVVLDESSIEEPIHLRGA